MRPLDSSSAQRGFTLVEMMVALALVAMMSIIIIESLRFAQRAYARIVQVDEATWEVFAAQRFLRRALESAYPFTADAAHSDARAIEGGDDRLAFSAPAVQSSAAGGLNRYELFVAAGEGNASRRRLLISWGIDRNGRTEGGGDAMHRETLIDNIASIQWSYAEALPSAPSAAGEIQWVHSWGTQKKPPALIRLQVRFAEKDARRWPDLIVAPRVTNDANCQFDMVGQECRGGA